MKSLTPSLQTSSVLYKLGSIQLLQSFSFYGVRSLLVLYFTQILLFNETQALTLYGNVMAFLYIAPLLGGWLIDKYWSSSLNLIIGVILVGVSTVLMSFPHPEAFFYGLSVLVIGQGLFKPTVPYMLDQLYPESTKPRSAAYTFYYMMLNVGAALAPFLLGIIKQKYGWQACFIGCLLISLMALFLAFQVGKLKGADIKKDALKIFKFLLANFLIGATIYYFLKSPQQVDQLVIYSAPFVGMYLGYLYFTSPNRQDMGLLFLVISLFGLFVILFEQSGGSIMLFLEKHVNRSIGGFEAIPASVFMSLNPFFIIALGFAFSRYSSSFPTLTPFQQLSLGFMLIVAGFGFLWMGAAGVVGGDKVSLGWVVLASLCHALGELLIVPVTLSLAAGFAPKNKKGSMIGLWCLAAAYGHYLAAGLAKSKLQLAESTAAFQGVFALTAEIALGCAVIVFFLGFKNRLNQQGGI